MRTSASAAALRLVPIALVLGPLAACRQQAAPARPATVVKTAASQIDELHALVAATRRHPSLVNPTKNAGPRIHVDPYPHSPGAPPHQHEMK